MGNYEEAAIISYKMLPPGIRSLVHDWEWSAGEIDYPSTFTSAGWS